MDTLLTGTISLKDKKTPNALLIPRSNKRRSKLKSLNGNIENKKTSNALLIRLSDKMRSKLKSLDGSIENMVVEVGNCSEMSKSAYELAYQKGKQASLLAYQKPEGDHVFTLIYDKYYDRPFTEDVIREDAVICDPWMGLVCPTKEYRSRLGNFKGYDFDDKHYNLITGFNPNRHKIITPMVLHKVLNFSCDVAFDQSFVDKLIKPLVEKTNSPYRKFLLMARIRPHLKDAIENELISEKEVSSWKNLYPQLKKYFATDTSFFPLIIYYYGGNETILRKKIKKALKKDKDPNRETLNGVTVLLAAAKNGYTDIVRELLKVGADPNKRENTKGRSALYLAAIQNYVEIVNLLLCHPNIQLDLRQESASRYRSLMNGSDEASRERMERHIENKIKLGQSPDAITCSLIEIAEILDYPKIVKALKAHESAKKVFKNDTFTFFTQTFNSENKKPNKMQKTTNFNRSR